MPRFALAQFTWRHETIDSGLWLGTTENLSLVVREGAHAPGTPNDVTFDIIWPGTEYLALNDAGQVAFLASLRGAGFSSSDYGLWSGAPGSLALLARRGDHAPGTEDGVVFSNLFSTTNTQAFNLMLNAAGQTAFVGQLTGSGISASNDLGIWATDRSGDLQLIAREGDPLEVAPGDFRTIGRLVLSFVGPNGRSTGNSDGRPSAFNNLGQLAFQASFTDGTSGIFVSNRVAVPEPNTLLLLGFGSLAVLWRRQDLVCALMLVAVFATFSADPARGESIEWVRQLGTSANDVNYGMSADGLGNVYISGSTVGSLGGPSAGSLDAFVSKYDAAGNFQWTQQLGTSSGDTSYGVSADGLGNVYISGSTSGSLGGPNAGNNDAFVSKYDAAGTLQWSRQLGTSGSDTNFGVSADGLGNVYFSGFTTGSLGGPSAGGTDAFVGKYDAAGTLQWSRQLGTSATDQSLGVSADGLGNVYISGLTGGSLGGPSAGGNDAFVSKYDAAGTLQWTQQLGTSSSVDTGYGVSADGLGNVYFSGFTSGSLGGPNAGSNDAFVSKYDAAGNFQWTQQLGTSSNDLSLGVSADGLGNVYFSGYTTGSLGGPSAGGSDAFVAKIADAPIPEPSTLLLLGFGSLAVLWRRRGLVSAAILAAAVGISCTDRVAADTFGSGANMFDIEFVSIGNSGNAADNTGNPNPGGSVPYTYRMGKFEISREMVIKANSAAGLGITLQNMICCGGNSADRPATGISWYEAARFVNWLNTTSGSTPAYKFQFQPGEVGYSADDYVLDWTSSDAGYNPNNIWRNNLARYVLPNPHEWYKAAYYDPRSGLYFDYPTESDSVPDGIDFLGDPDFEAVFSDTGFFPNNQPNDITDVGVLSPYGTAGQGGNVQEWQETDPFLDREFPFPWTRGIRGGSWSDNDSELLSSSPQAFISPGDEWANLGFRIVSIPEPSTLLLLCFGSLAVLWRRRGLVCASILAATVGTAISAHAVTIDTVPVGNPGNAGEVQSQGTFGAVGYNYRIGKTEVTNAQYVEFLNGVDPTGANTFDLYTDIMSSNVRGGINFNSGATNGSKYEIKPGRDNNPVVYVSWYDSIRFANWLHNGQGSGDTENGAYTLCTLVGAIPINGDSITRNLGAKWLLPSEDEWYKAAYHTSTDAVPYSDQPPGSGAPDPSNTANFFKDDGVDNGYDDGYALTGSTSFPSENALTDVGAYTLYAIN